MQFVQHADLSSCDIAQNNGRLEKDFCASCIADFSDSSISGTPLYYHIKMDLSRVFEKKLENKKAL